MRLIDADKIDFKEEIDPFEIPGAQYAVAQAPTIDAIPVDWLRERASRMLDFGEGVERIIKEWQDEQSK